MTQVGEWQTPVLVSDFDGTMTQHDFYRLALAKLTPPDMPDYWGEYLAGRLTHFEALRRIFSHIHADEDAVLAVACEMEVDPELGMAVAHLKQAGWQVVIASAGCAWYIRHLLDKQHVHVELHANPGFYEKERGLSMELPVNSPFFSPTTGISKEAAVREMLRTHAHVAFAGDGRPDLAAAMLVLPERRFARGWLAKQLTAEGVPFRAFDRWSEVAALLLESEGSC